MDEQKYRLRLFYRQLEMQYLRAVLELAMAHREWVRREKANAIISFARIIVGAIIASAIYLAGVCCLLAVI